MGLEFSSSGRLESLKRIERIDSLERIERIERETQRALEELCEELGIELGEEMGIRINLQELSDKIETEISSEFLKSSFRETSEIKSLKELKKRCDKAKTFGDIEKIKADYNGLMQSLKENRYTSALSQTGINAKVGIITEKATSDLPKIVETVVEQPTITKKSEEVIKSNKANILKEASKRTQQEKMATEIAEKAQKYYSSISDVTTGKSAKESAEVFETALKKADEKIAQEAVKRTQQEKMASEIAEKAQKYYSSISDVTTGKSAKESAEVIEIAQEAIKRTQQEKTASEIAEKAQKYYSSISDVTTGKSAKESAEVFESALKSNETKQNISKNVTDKTSKYVNKLKKIYSEKITPVLKSKKFKVIAIGTILTAITAGIIKHNKNKKQENSKLNTIK